MGLLSLNFIGLLGSDPGVFLISQFFAIYIVAWAEFYPLGGHEYIFSPVMAFTGRDYES